MWVDHDDPLESDDDDVVDVSSSINEGALRKHCLHAMAPTGMDARLCALAPAGRKRQPHSERGSQ